MALLELAYVTAAVAAILVNGAIVSVVYTRHADVRGSRWFVASLCLGAVWLAAQVVMMLSGDPDTAWAAYVVASKAAVASFATWAMFASKYSSADVHRHPLVIAGLGVVAVVVALPTVFDPVADLLYARRAVVTEPFTHVLVEPTLAYLAVVFVNLCLAGAGMLVLVRYLLSTPGDTGRQLVLLVAGALSVPTFLVVGRLDSLPADGVFHATYGLLPFSLLTALALFRFSLFEVRPVARNAVVETLQDPVFVLDADRRVVDCNRAARRLASTTTDPVGDEFATVHRTVADTTALPDHGEETASQATIDGADGERRHYSVNVSRVGEGSGDADLYSVVLRDVTALERSRWQLETQNERLDQVASTVSHDLRNPITVADGYAEMLAEEVADGTADAETVREFVDKIRQSHDRMSDIIEDVLTLAREGTSVEETEAVSLASVARAAWETVPTGDATLTVAADGVVLADRSKLLSIFENLFRNAIDHGGDGVSVAVGTTRDGFYVRDDGPGIPEEDREHVFEYGYSTGTEGTGLGLSITETMAESHGWTVGLDSDVAEGTTIRFGNVGRPTVDPQG